MRYQVDAEGFHEGAECPQCGSSDTITFRYVEGFEEYECPNCGYRSDDQELDDLTRYGSHILEDERGARVPIPRRSMKA